MKQIKIKTLESQLTRDLEKRLAPRRAIEAAVRAGRWRKANKDLVLISDQWAARMLGAALRMTGLYSRGVRNALAPVVRHARFEFENLPWGLDGFRILQLADLHIDGVDGLAEAVAERVEGLAADLWVMTGDYRFAIKGPHAAVYPRLQTILSRARASHGVVAILGNHDEADMTMELETLGVQVLVNEALEIAHRGERLWVVGVDDPHFYGCDDLDSALDGVPPDAFKILLAHSPEMFRQAAAAGIDLYLCGHTHAGQIRLPGIGAPRVNASCPRSYIHGYWKHGAMQGHTSAGVGCALLAVRYNCPPEINVIELVKREG